ncbi:MAG: alpha-amylase [Paludibacteraceae bacterium]|nr:alpha-amylase [Paludibacteraceae bacterium]
MKKLLTTTLLFAAALFAAKAQVPSQAEDVMLQAFYWNSHSETKWATLTSQADEIGSTFTLVWLPPASAAEGGGSSNMGYHPYQWPNLSSSWGNKSTLTALIQALHNKNCKVIADIVANHHAGNNACCSYPTENFGTYGSFQFDASQITKDDENGSGTGAKDAGYGEWQCGSSGGYCAARDLDHSNSNVQNHVIAYLKWMKNDIGYDGWRYDLVKGYLGKYTKMYNEAAGAYMSVGEYYDASYDALLNWVKETSYTSMVFDFAFHNAMVEWGGGSNYSKLSWLDGSTPRPAGLCHAAASRKYAVTFIDNHDTDEKHTDGNWPYRGDWEKANAVMLAAPGIPCVFWRHWVACKDNIKKMVAARRAAGIHSESDVVVNNTNGYYQATATGKKGKLICFVGNG